MARKRKVIDLSRLSEHEVIMAKLRGEVKPACGICGKPMEEGQPTKMFQGMRIHLECIGK